MQFLISRVSCSAYKVLIFILIQLSIHFQWQSKAIAMPVDPYLLHACSFLFYIIWHALSSCHEYAWNNFSWTLSHELITIWIDYSIKNLIRSKNKKKCFTIPEHLSSPPFFSGIRVTRSLVLYVCFIDCCLSFCTFSFGHCLVCSSSMYGFW